MIEPAITGEMVDGVNWLWRSNDTGELPSGEKEPFTRTAAAEVVAGEPAKLAWLAWLKDGELTGEAGDRLGGLRPVSR